MTNEPFIHLHNHTDYSVLDGAATCDALAKKAQELGMKKLAVTNHGTMQGVDEFIEACEKYGLEYIIGCEIYRTAFGRHERNQEKLNHMTLLARDAEGYANLCEMLSIANVEGFYYKPRVDDETLAKYTKGVMCLSGCMIGRLPQAILRGEMGEAEKEIRFLLDSFGKENFRLEVHSHGIQGQRELNAALFSFSKKYDIPLVAANDVHYVEKEDYEFHDALLAISTNSTLDQPGRMKFDCREFYLKSKEEMLQAFSGLEEAVENACLIGDRFEFKKQYEQNLYPTFPKAKSREDAALMLREMVYSADTERVPMTEDNKKRLDYELGVIEKSGYSDYFLLIGDIISYCRDNGIAVGPGRGSAVGSLVSYAVGITDVDPMEHGLLFERFLNPERVSPPDIDFDICSQRRPEVIEYVKKTYGEDKVFQISTYTKLGLRGAVKDACRVLDVPIAKANKLTEMLPKISSNEDGSYFRKDEAFMEAVEELGNKGAKMVWLAEKLVGINRSVGVHASALVVAPSSEKISRVLPLAVSEKGALVVQSDGPHVEKMGLLKLDALGLKSATTIRLACELIYGSGVHDFDISKITPNDEKTAQVYKNGNTEGVFQASEAMVRNTCKDMGVSSMEEFAIVTSLCRPGPMSLIPDVVSRKNGSAQADPIHPKCEKILKETYGLPIYQEQVMLMARELAGFSLGESDILRRAMGKKKKDVMAEMREKFIVGCKEHSELEGKEADEIFQTMEKFADYGFNKSHAIAYAKLSWQTAYLKAHHAPFFYAALLETHNDKVETLSKYLKDAQVNGVECMQPDVNISDVTFGVKDGKITYGLGGIKGISKSADFIIKERKQKGNYKSFSDFVLRTSDELGIKDYEMLCRSGALDSLVEGDRGSLLVFLKGNDELGIKKPTKKDVVKAASATCGSLDLFATEENSLPFTRKPEYQLTPAQKFVMEEESLGFSFSRHPYAEYVGTRHIYGARSVAEISAMDKDDEKKKVSLLCVVYGAEMKIAKKTQNQYGTGSIGDETGTMSLMCFKDRRNSGGNYNVSEVFDTIEKSKGKVLLITGMADPSRGQFIANEAKEVQPITDIDHYVVSPEDISIKNTLESHRTNSSKNSPEIFMPDGNIPVKDVLALARDLSARGATIKAVPPPL